MIDWFFEVFFSKLLIKALIHKLSLNGLKPYFELEIYLKFIIKNKFVFS